MWSVQNEPYFPQNKQKGKKSIINMIVLSDIATVHLDVCLGESNHLGENFGDVEVLDKVPGLRADGGGVGSGRDREGLVCNVHTEDPLA